MSSKFFDKQTDISDQERLAVDHSVINTSSITKLLLVLAEYLDHAGNDEIGAELMADFAIAYSEHESKKVSKQKINTLLN